MGKSTIDQLIINSPYEEPAKYWNFDRNSRTFDLLHGRRPAGYVVASQDSKSFDDPGVFVEIPLVNRIRPRVNEWRASGYPGVSGVTHRLLQHWTNPEEFDNRRFFFCQIEAVETLIWLKEASEADRIGLDIPSDGSKFPRLCAKMATGAGKTIVMAMVLAWQILNKVTNPTDARFSKNALVIAPGLTVKSRLAVLDPTCPENYYEAFRIVPPSILEKLRQGRVVVRNWHSLIWENEEQLARKRGVDKRGIRSDEAYVRDVLGELARSRGFVVINDEAHHAWRKPAHTTIPGYSEAKVDKETKWIRGLDRIHHARGIITAYDFSATPFTPSGKQSSEEALFGWIVSDFGLNDAIESGLVKTPRVVIHDDALPDTKSIRSRLYHIYNDDEVKVNLNRKAPPHEPLPELVTNAYNLLGFDWRETFRKWISYHALSPPVMITVANRTETAARIKYAFDKNRIFIEELCNPSYTLHVDSKVLQSAEATEDPITKLNDNISDTEDGVTEQNLTRKQQAEFLRLQVDTVGQQGKPGWKIQNVISVGMLSEGWDAKNVTHIMGLRAFSSQLLCEQVVGRGLRRTTYDVNPETGLFESEHVNIFGIPFTFLPHEGGENGPPPPPTPKTEIKPVEEKKQFEITWPNIVRIDHGYQPCLTLDWKELLPIELDASRTVTLAELASVVDGKPDVTKIDEIELTKLAQDFRTQRIVFEAARDVYAQMEPNWSGSKMNLLGQLVRLMEAFMEWDGLTILPKQFNENSLRRRLMLALNMQRLYQHIWHAIRFENTATLEPIFDRNRPIISTGDMRPWFTGKPCGPADRSHINFCVYDSSWEATEAAALSRAPEVAAWVKNDHLGFEVYYVFDGIVRIYRPDFLIRLTTGDHLILEVKGQETEQDRAKFRFLQEWVCAVNEHGGFGRWSCDISKSPSDVYDILARHYRS